MAIQDCERVARQIYARAFAAMDDNVCSEQVVHEVPRVSAVENVRVHPLAWLKSVGPYCRFPLVEG